MSDLFLILSLIGLSSAHYTFPWINVNGVNSTYWEYTRVTNNWETLDPVTNVSSPDMTCYDTAVQYYTGTDTPPYFSVAAGTEIMVGADPGGVCCGTYHPGVSQVYMAAVPSGTNADTWEPTGAVWFKVGEVPPITDGGTSITWVAQNQQYTNFTIPSQLPSGNYLVRVENIGLHVAESYGGAQFYIGCFLVSVTGGGSGTPSPLVAFPGAYTGYEPGILIDIYYPIPANYTMPGPPIWPPVSGTTTTTSSSSKTSTSSSSSKTSTTTTSSSKTTTTTTKSATTTTTSSGAAQTAYGQCGGSGWTGATTCVSGYTCTAENSYYSQCLPA